MKTHIIGYSHSKFGRLPGVGIEDLIVSAARDALANAQVGAADVDAVYVAHFNGGLTAQDFTAPLVLGADAGLRFKPVVRVENACASGSAAVFEGLRAIEGGAARIVMVVGAEKMTELAGADVGRILLRGSYLPEAGEARGFADVFARIASEYFDLYGDHSAAMAKIAAKNLANGVHNPYAHVQKPRGESFCATTSPDNPLVAPPLRRSDCAPVSDGAAALILAVDEIAEKSPWAIGFMAASNATDYLPLAQRRVTEFGGCSHVWRQSLAAAKMTFDDLQLVELHDCFSIAELIQYEAMGLAAPGKAHNLIESGTVHKGGRLPINPSGGLKSRGHPIGATGVSMHVMATLQLLHLGGDMQVPDATTAGIFNMGGVAVSNYCSILERTR